MKIGFNFSNYGYFEIQNSTTGLTLYFPTNSAEPECLLKCLSLTEECTAFSFNNFTRECRVTMCNFINGDPNSNWITYYSRMIYLFIHLFISVNCYAYNAFWLQILVIVYAHKIINKILKKLSKIINVLTSIESDPPRPPRQHLYPASF